MVLRNSLLVLATLVSSVFGATWVNVGKGSYAEAVASAPVFVQAGGVDDGGSASLAMAPFGSNVTDGNFVCVSIAWNSSTVTLTSVTSNRGSNLTLVGNPTTLTDNLHRVALAYGFCTSSGALTLTVNLSGSVSVAGMLAHEYSGVNSGTPVEDSDLSRVAFVGTGTDAFASGTVTVSTTNAKVVGFVSDLNVSDAFTTGTGYTGRLTTSTGSVRGETEDKTASAGDTTATFTSSVGSLEVAVGALVVKP